MYLMDYFLSRSDFYLYWQPISLLEIRQFSHYGALPFKKQFWLISLKKLNIVIVPFLPRRKFKSTGEVTDNMCKLFCGWKMMKHPRESLFLTASWNLFLKSPKLATQWIYDLLRGPLVSQTIHPALWGSEGLQGTTQAGQPRFMS